MRPNKNFQFGTFLFIFFAYCQEGTNHGLFTDETILNLFQKKWATIKGLVCRVTFPVKNKTAAKLFINIRLVVAFLIILII